MAHGDYTGSTKAALARQAAEDQQFAAQRMSMITEATATARQGVINLFTPDDEDYLAYLKDQIEVDGVSQVDPAEHENWKPVKFRASEDLDDITVGKDRHFTLKQGQVYKAPNWVARHLDSQSLVLH